jgi:hypothetical protein
MNIQKLRSRAGINETRNADGDAVLLADDLLQMLKRHRALSEHNKSTRLISEGAKLKRQVTEAALGSDVYRMKELAGLFEDDEKEDDEEEKDNGTNNNADYGYETERDGSEKGSTSGTAAKTELAALHGDMMDCWSSLRKCVMDCTIDGSEVPSALRSTIDKLGRAIEEMEQLADKV